MPGNIPDEGDRPHIAIINRWRKQYADYAHCIDHRAHRVTCVGTGAGCGPVPPEAADVAVARPWVATAMDRHTSAEPSATVDLRLAEVRR